MLKFSNTHAIANRTLLLDRFRPLSIHGVARVAVGVAMGGLIVVGLLVGGAMLREAQAPVAPGGHAVAIEGNGEHGPIGGPLTYRNRPPSSGNHYAHTSGYGVFEHMILPGFWVHTLEHGGIVVLYNCEQPCPDVVSQLRAVRESAPASRLFAETTKLAVIPYSDMDHAIASVAWGFVDEMDRVDKDRILAFYDAHVDRGPETAL